MRKDGWRVGSPHRWPSVRLVGCCSAQAVKRACIDKTDRDSQASNLESILHKVHSAEAESSRLCGDCHVYPSYEVDLGISQGNGTAARR